MKTINLSDVVMVSDPCYKLDTWCQSVLTRVLPGKYYTKAIITDLGAWGRRCTGLVAVHQDFVGAKKRWYKYASIGVDSGQAGIFDMASYRNPEVAAAIQTPDIDFTIPYNDDPGDSWYEKMCRFTLSENSWGAYDGGVVSSSGIGDGMYDVSVWKSHKQIVAINIDFGITNTQRQFIESLESAF